MKALNWKELWLESQNDSIMSRQQMDRQRWNSFWDTESSKYLSNVIKHQLYYRDIVDHMRREDVFKDGDNVLDIACGPGTYSLLFAERAGSVSALDQSGGMLSVLGEEAARRGLANIKPVHCSWDMYDSNDKYDLVFTALSPVIKGPEEFLSLERHSKRSCCYITFGEEEDFRIRRDIWRILFGYEMPEKKFNISYPFNLLVSMGRKPNIRHFRRPPSDKVPVQEFIDANVRYFGLFTTMDEEKTRLVKEYANSMSKEGYIEDRIKKTLAALYWDVPE